MIKDLRTPIVILHGWGLRGSTYNGLKQVLEKEGYLVFAPDLPGFGNEPLIGESMNLSDYVEFVKDFLKRKKIESVIFIGHSFGGRIALKFAWQYPELVKKIVLTGVPVIRHISLRGRIGFLFTISFGKIFSVLPYAQREKIRKLLYFAVGEWDYYKSGPLKEVFKNIIDEDLTKYAKEQKVPVFLLWGQGDRLTPASDVEKIKKISSGTQSVIIENTGHKLPYENPQAFFNALKSFL